MQRVLIFCIAFLSVVSSIHARLSETVQQIKERYGKPLKGEKAEYPATVAGLYETNGFRIVVGFYQDKSYYEKFYKLDPQNPKAIAPISQAERETILKANCSGCHWTVAVTTSPTSPFPMPMLLPSVETSNYERSDGLAKGTYDTQAKVLIIRSSQVEKQNEEKQKESLRNF